MYIPVPGLQIKPHRLTFMLGLQKQQDHFSIYSDPPIDIRGPFPDIFKVFKKVEDSGSTFKLKKYCTKRNSLKLLL